MFTSQIYLMPLLLIIIFNLFICFFVLFSEKGWREVVTRRFFYFVLAVFLWQLANFFVLVFKDPNLLLFLVRATYVTGIIAPYLIFHFISVFPNPNPEHKYLKYVDLSLLVLAVITAIFATTNLLVISVGFESGFPVAAYGLFYDFFVAISLVYYFFIFYYGIKNYRAANHIDKAGVRLCLIGISLLIILTLFTDLISPFIIGSDILSNFGVYSSFFTVIFITYAIIKHQLFNIKVILTETAVGVVAIAILAQFIFSQNTTDFIVNAIILLTVIYGGSILIRSVQKEIKQKEELQVLTTQLAQANSHLQELDKMKTEFVSLASHELLTPVSAIEGYLSMLLDEKLAKVEDPKAVKFLDNVYKSAKRLARLVTDLLNISRIEEGRLLVEKQDVNLSDIIQQVVDELKFKADDGKQKVVFSSQPTADSSQQEAVSGKPLAVSQWTTFGDADKIKEVVVNLIGNSIKYSREPGTITISIAKVPTTQITDTWNKIEAEIKARPLDDQEAIKSAVDEHLRGLVGDEQLLVSVKDNGIGIPKDELPRLFKKFHRVGDFTTAESQGTGLGLYISRALVELNHGRIWADSEGQGKGSTFSFSLPLLEHKQEIIELEKQAPQTGEQLKPLAHPTKAAEDI